MRVANCCPLATAREEIIRYRPANNKKKSRAPSREDATFGLSLKARRGGFVSYLSNCVLLNFNVLT